MQNLPLIVICGRPNVGKSTIFNVLAKRRIAIVDPSDGVTRDRIMTEIDVDGKKCCLVDTGGIGLESELELGDIITQQARQAMEDAAVILFIVDVQAGVAPLDSEVAKLLKKYYSHKKIRLIANKTDTQNLIMEKENFRKLGFGDPMCISAAHYSGIGELKEYLWDNVDEVIIEEQELPLKIAVVGKPNAGKSTFINALADENRVIVSEIPGTTRDSVDVQFEKDGKKVIAIDTAGLKKGKNVRGNVDFYSQNRAQKAIRRADVVIFMFDATSNLSKIDKQIADMIRQEYKPAIITINKWDLAKDVTEPEQYERYLNRILPGMRYSPLSFITAKTGKNAGATIDLARNMYKQSRLRVSTGELNRVLQQEILTRRRPPTRQGKAGKIYYATQINVNPPTFLLFVNYPASFHKKYQRYLFNQFQSKLGFTEVPVKLIFKEKSKNDFHGFK